MVSFFTGLILWAATLILDKKGAFEALGQSAKLALRVPAEVVVILVISLSIPRRVLPFSWTGKPALYSALYFFRAG